jgi:hypothetical protein
VSGDASHGLRPGRGFNERLAVESNDVDFCIRVRQAGLKIIWTPHAELKHHKRASRKDLRWLPTERAYMRERWRPLLDADPFYTPNLALDRKSFDLASEPLVHRPWLLAGRRRWGAEASRVLAPAPGLSLLRCSLGDEGCQLDPLRVHVPVGALVGGFGE